MQFNKIKSIFLKATAVLIILSANCFANESVMNEIDALRESLSLIRDQGSAQYVKQKQRLQRLIVQNNISYSYEARLYDAQRLIREGKYNSAIYELKSLIASEYHKSKCLELLGDICQKTDRPLKKMFNYYMSAYNEDNNNYSAAFKLAKIYIHENKITPALMFLERGVDKCNNDTVLNELALYIKNNLHPTDKYEANTAYDILGAIYIKIGKKPDAMTAFKNALQTNPNDLYLKYYLGDLFYCENLDKNAIILYDSILQDNPDETAIRTSKAKALASVGNILGADREYRIILAGNPNSVQARYGLYKLYEGKLPPDKILEKVYSTNKAYVASKKDILNFAEFLKEMNDYNGANSFVNYVKRLEQEELERILAEQKRIEEENLRKQKEEEERIRKEQELLEQKRAEELRKKEIERRLAAEKKLKEEEVKKAQIERQKKIEDEKRLKAEQLKKAQEEKKLKEEQAKKLLAEKKLKEEQAKIEQLEKQKKIDREKREKAQQLKKEQEEKRLKEEQIKKEQEEKLKKEKLEKEQKEKEQQELLKKAQQQKEYEEKTIANERQKSIAKNGAKFKQMEEQINKYMAIDPKDANTYIAIANTYKTMEMPTSALRYFKEAQKLDPANSEIYYNLGLTYMELNSYVTSKSYLIKAINLDKDNNKAKNLLGFVNQTIVTNILNNAYAKFEKSDYISAFQILDDGIKEYPKNGQMYYYRALVFDKMNRNAAQIIDLQKAIEFNPGYYMAYYQLGHAYEKINDERSALVAYEKFLSTEPDEKELIEEVQKKVLELGKKYY